MGVDYSKVELLLSVYDLSRALHVKNIYIFSDVNTNRFKVRTLTNPFVQQYACNNELSLDSQSII